VKWRLVFDRAPRLICAKPTAGTRVSAPGLGAEFLAEIDSTIQVLMRDPRRHPVYYRGFYRVLVRRFPYKVFYRLEGDRIIVFRILHARRDHPRLLGARH